MENPTSSGVESSSSSCINQAISSLQSQLSCARNEIKNLRQQIVSLKHTHKKDVDLLKNAMTSDACSNCTLNGPSTSTTSVKIPSSDEDFPYKFIGYIETGFSNKRGVPRQPGFLAQSQGIIRLDNDVLTNPGHALEGLEQFSHMWILFYFHDNQSTHVRAKVAPPRLNGERTGVFSTRSPHRPTPIGLSLVKIDSVEDDKVYFSGVDMIDGTPVLDLKPYIPQYDMPCTVQSNSLPRNLHNAHTDQRNDYNWDRDPLNSNDDDFHAHNNLGSEPELRERHLVGESSENELNQLLESINLSNLPIEENTVFDTSSPILLQREAPEGSEGGSSSSPPTPAHSDNVRVANWISNAPALKFEVQFSEECVRKINDLSSINSVQFKSKVVSILSEDPRSVYVRERYADESYTCTIDKINVICFFDDVQRICLVTDVENVTLNT